MNARLLSLLYFQPLMIERNAWDAILAANDGVHHQRPPVAAGVSPAKLCSSCDEPMPAPASRYFRVLQLTRLAGDLSQSFNDDAAIMPADTAIITIRGMIVKHAEEWECDLMGLTDLDDVDAALAHVAADANIRNLLLNFVNCPGGSCIGVPETAARVEALRRSKNVISFTDSVCCSGGIYIGSQASEFFVTSSAHTGSIGAIRPPIIDISEQLKANLVKTTVIKAGKFKDTGTMLRPVTPEEIAMLQAYVDRVNAMFTGAVKSARPRMSAAAMEGQIFFGAEAVEVGLADAVVDDMAGALAAF
jgi:signal peptide peptidase SppA